MRSKPMKTQRRGTVAAFTAVASTMLIGFVALSVDVGMLYNVRAEMQRTADAGALAGAWTLVNENRLKTPPDMAAVVSAARAKASLVSGLNDIQKLNPTVDQNASNLATGDVVMGRFNNPNNLSEAMSYPADASQYNTVLVRVHRDGTRNGPIELWFARIFGLDSTNMQATAAASLNDGIVGYRVTDKTGNADLLPIALHVDIWNQLLAGTRTTGDSYAYNPATKGVSGGADGVFELNLYPGAGGTQLPPGNFGTVNIGPSNNSTCHLSSQIRYGVTKEDLSYYPNGELKFGDDGTLPLSGDPGLSAGIKDDLAAIIGKPRAIPLFNKVTGNGNNANYTIVGFAGVRVLDVKLTGSMDSKYVMIQPAMVVDDSTVTGTNGNSKYVYQPVRLTR